MHPLLRSAPTPMLCLSALFFVLALALPFFWMEPGFGDPILEEFLELLFGESFDAKPYSVLGGIWILFADGDWVIAIVLLLFSVLFPIGKLLALFILLFWPTNR